MSRARRRTTPKVYAWIRGLLDRGEVPGLQVLLVCSEADDWQGYERGFIASSPNLTNMSEGGEGIDSAIISAARAGTYIVTHPDGADEVVTNLSAFCLERGIPNANAFKVLAGKRRVAHGYKFRYPDEPPRKLTPLYLAEHPNGTVETVYSLKEWAETHGFSPTSARRAACGQRSHYRGIRFHPYRERLVDS